jgi:hypothetical protein
LSSRYDGPLAPGDSPAAERNKEPILEQLRRVLPAAGTVVEVASGTGQHAVYFARALPALVLQPTEPDAELRAAIARRVAAAALPNLRPPLAVDVLNEHVLDLSAEAVLCSNLLHIAPWDATPGLFAHGARWLSRGAPLVTYGPYKVGGEHTAPSNAAFDVSLRGRNPEWGVRDVAEVAAAAERAGFLLEERVSMPANNFLLVFRRQ